jgi:hypothetical protein
MYSLFGILKIEKKGYISDNKHVSMCAFHQSNMSERCYAAVMPKPI